MKKLLSLIVFIILVGASFLSGCVDRTTDDNQEDLENTIDENEAYDILMSKILKPGFSNNQGSAFMLSEMLKKGDVITSENGNTYTIEKDSWFVFIDDAPWAFFSHPVRYIMINAQDGEYETINEFWPPFINNNSMWDKLNHNRGSVKDIYPVLNQSVPINDTSDTGAPTADYGDAPDTQNAYYGVSSCFPTYYNTSNSRVGYPGAHTLNVGEETLGLTVSAEVDANDPNDPDLVPNLVDSDKDDNVYVGINSQNAQLSFTVKVSQNAPNVPRYINVLIDFDQNGSWMKGSYGSEWPVKNFMINVTPGTTKTITTPVFLWGNKTILSSPVWMRVSLTRTKVNETMFSSVGGWDGSGQFEYGEIEDHIVYLTDDVPEPEEEWPPWPGNPPSGRNPNPPGGGGGGPNPPGSSTGPCGTTVNYHSIIINGGDSSSHLGKGLSPASEAVDTMTGLLADQGYSSSGSLGPGSNSMSDLEDAFENLKSAVKCGDHVLVYIVGHGKPASEGGGIALKGTSGKTHDTMKSSDLSNLLGSIPACPDEDCDVEGKCCHVTVVIESCYAGNFNTDGVKGAGRTVMGSSDDEPADATGGGVFTSGFSDSSNNEDSDEDDDGTVTPGEAFSGANKSVSDNNKKSGRGQEPWSDSQECECKCPCSPSIDVDKYAWDDDWVSEMDAIIGQEISFRCEIENDGKCRNVSDLEIVDTLPNCLSYNNDAEVTYLDSDEIESTLDISAGLSDTVDGGMQISWDIGNTINLFAPDEKIIIDYSATTILEGYNTNVVQGSAQCTYDPSITVSESDSVTINVSEESDDIGTPPAEDILTVFLEGYGECYCSGEECSGTLVITSFGAEDISGGDYPIKNILLTVNGVEEYSESVNTSSYSNSRDISISNCDTSYDIEVTATNSLDQNLSVSDTINVETVLFVNISAVATSEYGEGWCNSNVDIDFVATDLTGGTYPITELEILINGENLEITQSLPTSSFLQEHSFSSDCDVTHDFQMTVTNINGKTIVATKSITTPSP